MCGIAGYFGTKEISESSIKNTLGLMKRRGPNSQQSSKVHSSGNSACLLHSRLSIIDLDERANQPFSHNNHHLVFNGEIYNYQEVRVELQKLGWSFTTESDTEVLLKSYLQWQEKCLERLEGMWSFAVFNSETGELFICRDRFGEKPLYIYQEQDGLYFASEVKFIKALANKTFSVNTDKIFTYLCYGYKFLFKGNESFFHNIERLPPGTYAKLNHGAEFSPVKYWQPDYKRSTISLDEAIEETTHLLEKSLKLRLRADVPLAFCLSGGVDSASLVSLAAKKFNSNVKTYSIIDHDSRYDERHNINATVNELSCKNTQIELNFTQEGERLKNLIEYHDSPISTISYLVHSHISEAVASDGNKVVLSGSGADEIFTGYFDHYLLHIASVTGKQRELAVQEWQHHILPNIRNPLLQNPLRYVNNPESREHIHLNSDVFCSYLRNAFQKDFTEVTVTDNLLKNRMYNELFHEIMPVILHEDDMNSMYYSIENRSPFLDTSLVNFLASAPTEYLIKNGYNKYLLRMSMNGILNDQVRLDRKKMGFNASLNSVFDFNSKSVQELFLDESGIFEFVDKNAISEMIQSDFLKNSESKFLFNFINCKMFMELNGS